MSKAPFGERNTCPVRNDIFYCSSIIVVYYIAQMLRVYPAICSRIPAGTPWAGWGGWGGVNIDVQRLIGSFVTVFIVVVRMLLWHGSRLTNWVGILSQGLRIAPPEAPVTGYMVRNLHPSLPLRNSLGWWLTLDELIIKQSDLGCRCSVISLFITSILKSQVIPAI